MTCSFSQFSGCVLTLVGLSFSRVAHRIELQMNFYNVFGGVGLRTRKNDF